ncbi:TatD DNase family protein [Rhodothalassium salexigens DSM 2132]|uniref:TatD DNase family protein n=1 Tax=Rhodothalassium salexigens DSM 2132 TaxID=1188247 RepID=A0A4R2PRH3_RHOSA|nr:TatD family hydrolase [Rhodothalassium salexigens]MBB4210173.1 TatD DNase family protein [Rhodothalassium salexigens DSM 2132]MBK1638563.1 LuxR family transcriptional regulator [Rhodothalassium salexigens DSM 2132]TCP38337.1 TatD DNase family protein [Rhodothalassium salexigens DSM 2132]
MTAQPYLVDSHCHLNYKGLADDVEGTIERARRAGVATLLTVNTKISEFEAIRDIAAAHDDVWCSVGVHPHEAEAEAHIPEDALVDYAAHPKVVAVGETGLDFYYDNAPRDAQERSFRKHIAAARRSGLPVIVHTRDAEAETARIMAEEMAKGPFRAVIHCFSGTPQFAEQMLEHDFFISFSGIVTFKNSYDVKDAARLTPLGKLLVETDAPFLAPVPHRGQRCEPAFVADTAAYLADLKDQDLDLIKRTTAENFFRLFTRATPPGAATLAHIGGS